MEWGEVLREEIERALQWDDLEEARRILKEAERFIKEMEEKIEEVEWELRKEEE